MRESLKKKENKFNWHSNNHSIDRSLEYILLISYVVYFIFVGKYVISYQFSSYFSKWHKKIVCCIVLPKLNILFKHTRKISGSIDFYVVVVIFFAISKNIKV